MALELELPRLLLALFSGEVQERLEARVGEDADLAFFGGEEDLVAAPAEGDLVGAVGLFVRSEGFRLGGGEDEDCSALMSLGVSKHS